jgi:hypothetical protein
VTTVAGSAGIPGNWDGIETHALFNLPTGIAVDANGNLIVADSGSSTIRLVAPDHAGADRQHGRFVLGPVRDRDATGSADPPSRN